MSVYIVIGRRWFQKREGNTYHSVEVYKDDRLLERLPYEYGYGNMYLQNAMEIIKEDIGVDKKHFGSYDLMEMGHSLINSVTDVERKKDL